MHAMEPTPPAIRVDALTRTYTRPRRRRWPWSKPPAAADAKDFVALGGVDLEVRPGELFGLLGPNGAGKTTLIKILTTLLAPTTGSAFVDGLDVVTEADRIRPLINMVSGGESSGYGILNVRENLWLFARIYGVPTAVAHERIDKMMEVVGLTEKAKSRVSHLSTGQRQKMNFCRGFITDPKILFLDEPTLGLDVTSARAIRGFVREWMRERPERTLLLTTHYMAEADELCDRLAIIDHGKVLACDTPANLKRRVQKYPLYELSLAPGNGPADWSHLEKLPGVHQAQVATTPTTVELKVSLLDEPAIGSVVQALVTGGGRILSLKKVEPTLEDVFIELVGHGLSEGEPPAQAAAS
ncbi:abc transporter atp-binding protein : Antibiotic transport system ATP-binding protein OS=Candidatus Acetothermus autotrophicum GN=HGMM_OP2C037 PE=4 SV=1: ABC_tran [Gemmataceae bacterium]|nr:abc transporter atp-binding protein : Antibiotic transport system ATP-binding protein OS=Candidatus Acetothermus autotrophicum GN=HGMM_OP2C037 PE=4 SV=1: ABC_tran [Gemmataceae bacterium]VTU01538.1 abc transporter atp-binding protein : Antibiotic transport system ATP-binding protein OS=Candidatus Acetothermus autotrophicum GN=HGMM_OP2C037 PE=4 SV=1: ABC_tran [Gemmataceae bacterium]